MGASPSAQPGYPGHPGFIAAALGNKTEEEVKYFLMPVYYTTAHLLPHEKEIAVKAWKEIANARAKEFWRVKNLNPDAVTCKTPMEYFGNQFFLRLFDTHPTCRSLFAKGSMKEGQALLRMMSFIVSEIDNEEKLEKNLTTLAHSHNKMGVKAVEYGLFGEVLFATLKKCLGEEYDQATHAAWIKIYSRILSVVVPIVVHYEITHKPEVAEKAHKRMEVVLGAHVTSREQTTPSCSADDPAVALIDNRTIPPPAKQGEGLHHPPSTPAL